MRAKCANVVLQGARTVTLWESAICCQKHFVQVLQKRERSRSCTWPSKVGNLAALHRFRRSGILSAFLSGSESLYCCTPAKVVHRKCWCPSNRLRARGGKQYPRVMSASADIALAPGLDRTKFQKNVTLKALKLPKQHCHRYMRLLKGLVLTFPKIKAVQKDEGDPDKRILLLREDITDLESSELPTGLKDSIQKDSVEEIDHTLHLDYSHMSLDMVLKGWEIPSSFETVGHIAHLNLRDEYLPYKRVIGQVVLDKNPAIKTVVNKVGSIENEFRVLPMEVIAGEDRLEAMVKQHNAQFKLHYAEVYWNSRLEQEHQRLVEQFKPGEVIADVMAGIGPFAIPAGLQGNQVYANDLNPKSFHYLRENVQLNKVGGRVLPFQLDGREFIRRMAGSGTHSSEAEAEEDLRQNGALCPAIPSGGVRFNHAVMNLPASAVEFLDAFKGSFHRGKWQQAQLPLVHVYTFAKSDATDEDIRACVERHLGGRVGDRDLCVRLVRDVAPNKRMMCVTFRVPEEVGFAPAVEEQMEGGAPKKQKVQY